MNAPPEVCIDSGILVKLVVREPDSHLADSLFEHWTRQGAVLIAPVFVDSETDSVLRQKVLLRHELTEEQAGAAFERLQSLPILRLSMPGQRQLAWELAREFAFPTVYDAVYLALASLRACEFWTADRRLYERVRTRLSLVRLLGDHPTDSIR